VLEYAVVTAATNLMFTRGLERSAWRQGVHTNWASVVDIIGVSTVLTVLIMATAASGHSPQMGVDANKGKKHGKQRDVHFY
jgi:hypothetical protein